VSTGFLTLLLATASVAPLLAQKVTYGFDSSIDFSKYRTYVWVPFGEGRIENSVFEEDVKEAVDEQLVAKGLRRVDRNPDLLVAYQAGTHKAKQLNSIDTGGWAYGPGWNPRGTERTTLPAGTLRLSFADASTKDVIWCGQGTGTVGLDKDLDKSYKKLQIAVAKILQNLPPKSKP